MLKISAVIIARNAERSVGRTLDSLAGLTEEVVVVDSGSSDRTPEICRAMGARVLSRGWDGYGRQKNFAIEQAVNPWVLSLDSDEALSPELAAEIAALDDSTPFSGFRLPRLNYYFGSPLRHGGQFPDYQLRLFRRDCGLFNERPVHESVVLNGRAGTLTGVLEHDSHPSLDSYFEKFHLYTALEAERILASGETPGPFAALRRMLCRPAGKFLWRYVLKGGFLDGVPGLLAALFNSMAMVVSYARFWEIHRKRAARP